MFIYIREGFCKKIRHNSHIFLWLAGNNFAVDHNKTLLKERADHNIISPGVFLKLCLKGQSSFCEAVYIIFAETKQIQLGRRSSQKTFRKICFLAAE